MSLASAAGVSLVCIGDVLCVGIVEFATAPVVGQKLFEMPKLV